MKAGTIVKQKNEKNSKKVPIKHIAARYAVIPLYLPVQEAAIARTAFPACIWIKNDVFSLFKSQISKPHKRNPQYFYGTGINLFL